MNNPIPTLLILLALATSPIRVAAGDSKAEKPGGLSLLENYAYSPKYSRNELKKRMDRIVKIKLTDADFFGQHKNGKWVKESMLDYAYKGGALRDVEAAAKRGKYDEAAAALLAYFKARKPIPLTRKPDCKVEPLPKSWQNGDTAWAAMALAREYLPNAAKTFKRKDCTARDCVEYLKKVVLLGMQWSNGYSSNTTINGLGGNWIPWHYHDAVVSLEALPELSGGELWIAKSCEYLNANLKYVIQDDGSYIEHTFGYPRKILPLMLELLDVYLERGLPVSERYRTDLHRMSRYLMFCALPNGPGIEWGEGHMGDSKRILAKAARYFNDPEMIWWTTNGKEGTPPVVTDVAYPRAKISVFRSSWEESANYLFFAPRTGGSHYTSDQNVIELYAHGQRLLRDTGMCSYSRDDPAFDWIRHMSRSQNTVEVDEKGFPRFPKEKEEGPCGLEAASSARAGFARGWGGGYPDVRHERNVFFIRETGLCVVQDLLKPRDGKPHTYDQCWHFDPVNTYKSDAKNARVWTTNAEGANLDIVPVLPEKRTLLLRKGWNMFPRAETTYPSFRQTVKGTAEFLTVLSPTPPGSKDRTLKAELVPTAQKDVRALRIVTGTGEGVLILSNGKDLIQVAGIETDATCAYVQFGSSGGAQWAVRQGGTRLGVANIDVACDVMKDPGPPPLPLQP